MGFLCTSTKYDFQENTLKSMEKIFLNPSEALCVPNHSFKDLFCTFWIVMHYLFIQQFVKSLFKTSHWELNPTTLLEFI